MRSIMEMTFPKPFLPPLSASAIRSSSGPAPRVARSAASARPRAKPAEPARSCTKLAPVAGSVFLNSSRASSSLSTRMVSARACSSSARACFTASHSLAFVSQPFSSSARNSVSSPRDSLVSSRSLLVLATSMPRSPMRLCSASIWLVSTPISFLFEATRASKFWIAAASSDEASARSFSISSLSCLSMPTISPDFGTYSWPWPPARKASSVCRASSESWARSSAKLRSAAAALVCRKEPAMPSAMAGMALARAATFVSASAFSLA
mmetsp:Transcript_72473/g.205725  ORF Transcript_72473/g.205725 Transcript_72473/m.205725 type:complete len:266 (+) Transcript_72473:850-1647(+)